MIARSNPSRTECCRIEAQLLALVWLSLAAVAFSAPPPRAVVMGQTFSIAEPDALTEIESAVRQRDWQSWMRKKPRDYGAFEAAALPVAKQNASRLFDPTYTLPFDLKDQNGKLLFARGTRVNVYERMKLTLPGRFIVIGPHDSDLKWLEEEAKPTSADKILLASGNVLDLRARTQRNLFRLDERFVERFGLKATPAIVTQEGTQLRVTEYALAR